MSELLWGIDLGGTKIECAVLTDGMAIARHRIETQADKGYEHILERIALALHQTEEMVVAKPRRVGIGTPGTRDPKTGLMRGCNTTALNGQPLLKDLKNRLGVPVKMANDANCFALAEALMGAGKGRRVVFGVILGTGVGGGIVVDEKLIEGLQGIAGEWGHNQLEPNGEPCYCGRTGCVETVLAGPWLEIYYLQQTGVAKNLPDIVNDSRAGSDPAATKTIARLIAMFGKAIGPIVNILDPDAIILGGGVGNIDELYELDPEAAKLHIFNPDPKINVLRPALGDSAGVFGAALL